MTSETLPELDDLQPICPRCHGKPLERCHYHQVEVDVCPQCAGLWCRASHANPQVSEVLGPQPRAETFPGEIEKTSLPCPECGSSLEALKIAGVRRLEVDRCVDCGGVWFDHREWDFLRASRRWQVHLRENTRETTWNEWWFQLLLGLPVEFNFRPRSRPWATIGIVALCVAVYAFLTVANQPEWIELLAFEMQRLPSLWGFAGLITSQFVHGGLLHLVSNMYFLYVLGDNVEDVLGPGPFLVFFLFCGMAGDLAFGLVGGAKPLIGASGGVAAVMAAYLVLFRDSKLTFMLIIKQIKVPAVVWIVIWILFQFVGLVTDPASEGTGIAWISHVGSFMVGLILILAVRGPLVDRHPLLHLLANRRLKPS